jgi:hypothetical protein
VYKWSGPKSSPQIIQKGWSLGGSPCKMRQWHWIANDDTGHNVAHVPEVEVAVCALHQLFPLMCSLPCGPEPTSSSVHYRSVISPTNVHPITAIFRALSTCRPDTSHTFLLACQNSIQYLTGQVLAVYTQVTLSGNPLGPPAFPQKIRNQTSNDTLSHPRKLEFSILCIWHI